MDNETRREVDSDARERVIAGEASRKEAQEFIEELETRLVKTLNTAADATNHLAQEKDAARNLVDAITELVKTETLSDRARLGVAAIQRHEAESPDYVAEH